MYLLNAFGVRIDYDVVCVWVGLGSALVAVRIVAVYDLDV